MDSVWVFSAAWEILLNLTFLQAVQAQTVMIIKPAGTLNLVLDSLEIRTTQQIR